jgi:pimeloyl-ACP methyl ester carboxylesterase
MQRRAFALQAESAGATEARDPLDENPSLLARLDLPALVAAGEREPFSEFRECAETIAASLPRARLAVIDGAGHLAPLETPAAFRELLLGFLAEHAGD